MGTASASARHSCSSRWGSAQLSFGAVIVGSPFWRTQPCSRVACLLALVIVPLYAFVLIRKLSQARQQAEEANRAKSLFLTSVSHESPHATQRDHRMGALLANGHLSTEQRDMNKTVMIAARALLSSIDGILDLSRIEAGKMPELQADFEFGRAPGSTATDVPGSGSD